jgi:hypothetical protein
VVRKLLRERIGYFLNNHERSFRTEIILVPALVISIKVFSDILSFLPLAWQLIGTIFISLFLYICGMFVILVIGDKVWHRVIRKANPIDRYQGVFYQNKGAGKRERAVSRIFYDERRDQYIYRGIAYDSAGKAAAAWEMKLSNYERIDGDLVLYFVGRSTISQELNEYKPSKFELHVFVILFFSGRFKFRGGGFDFLRKADQDDDRSSFPIAGTKLDEDYLESHCISKNVLVDFFGISEQDRSKIFQYS